jgi:transposase
MAHATLITGLERRRRWSEEEKLAILAAAFAPEGNVSEVSRRTDISTSLIYRWRKDFAVPAGFAPAVLTDGRVDRRANEPPSPAIVVELTGGARVMIGAGAASSIITATLRALR